MNVYKEAENLKDELISIRRHLHQYPEIGMQLTETVAYVEDKLKEYGFVTKRYGECGVSAIAGNGSGCILLRADMDALPMQEESTFLFRSEMDGRAHTCGHDVHTAMLLGAAKILKDHEDELPCTVKFMFQPGEEIGEGAKSMLQAGLLQEPTVDCAFSMHVNSQLSCGVLATASGVTTSNSTVFDIHIEGNGCHGSTPYLGVDPMRIACSIYQGIQSIISQEIKPTDIAVVSLGSIQAGTAHNIIPQNAVMKGTIRTFDDDCNTYIMKRIEEISEYSAKAYHGTAKVTFPAYMPSVHNNKEMNDQFLNSMRKIIEPQHVMETKDWVFGSEDFGFVTREVPSLMVILGAREGSISYGQHHPKVLFNEDCLVIGCACYVQSALTLCK